MKNFYFSCIALLVFFNTNAQLRLPALFSNHMVLQQKTLVTVWGWTTAAREVSIVPSWNNQPVIARAGFDGRFEAKIATPSAGGPYSIDFSSVGSVINVSDVYIGEVWLASGQSNMEFFVGKTKSASYTGVVNHDEVMNEPDLPLIRQIDVPNKVANEPQKDFIGDWKPCFAATIDTFSAVAFFFAKKIHKATGFPIGIINSTWGGTPAESWTKKEVLQSFPNLQKILDRYDQLVKDFPQANAEFKIIMQAWQKDTSKSKGPAPTAPVGPSHNRSPYKLYNGMIAPLIPYSLAGVIWYQGESNADRPVQYQTLFPAMISQWREDFNAADLPFYFVQISPHRSQNPEIREAQLVTYQNLNHTGMAVTLDNGDSLDIHPRNKQLVGERLARWALKNEYGEKNLEVSGPLLQSSKVDGNKIILSFSHAKKLVIKQTPVSEFTIAGDDQVFHTAVIQIKAKKIVVSCDAVQNPKAVRYAWRNIPDPMLYNEEGLPASPFRTDNWPLRYLNAQ
jgi:sialate O-acetylesterase